MYEQNKLVYSSPMGPGMSLKTRSPINSKWNVATELEYYMQKLNYETTH
jgi:hypothetical protein